VVQKWKEAVDANKKRKRGDDGGAEGDKKKVKAEDGQGAPKERSATADGKCE
jgi:hypothetical protein